MGQKPSKLEVAESCLKPHHPHKCSDVDLRKLRALIKSGKLSPCYLPCEGEDWDARGLEECPICFLSYPALNRSQCCSKEICTECFLQVKLPNGNRGGALCPFCKSEFSVYFKGPRSAEEKEVCRAEERRISQATLRAREAEEARSEERAMKRHMERIEEQEKQAAAAAAQPAPSEPERMDSQGDGSGRLARRRSGNVDEEALRAVLLSLDLSEYIPSTIVSSSGLDLDDALLQQAIQASLREQDEQEEEYSPLSPVPPDAVAFSPLAQGTSAFSDSPAASPSQRLVLEGGEAEGSRGREDAAGTRYDDIVDHVFWEEVDLQTRPSTAGTSEQPLSQEEPSSSSRSESPRPEVGLVQDGTSSSPDDSRGQTAELQPCAGPSSGSTKLGGEGQSGHPQAPAPQGETAGRADLFNSQELAGNLTGPPQAQAAKVPQRGSSGFNPLSTMSSSTMESLLLTVRDFEGGLDTHHSSVFQDIPATPQTPIMLSDGSLPGLGSPVSQKALDTLPAELSSACVAALLRPAAQAALSQAVDNTSAAASPSKPGTGSPPLKEVPAEGLAAEGRSVPSGGDAKEGGQGSSRAAGARGAAFTVKVNLAAAAAPRSRHAVTAQERGPETEKAEVPSVAEGPAVLGAGSGPGMAELPVEAGSTASAVPSATSNTWEGSNTGAAEAVRDQRSKAERASSTEGPLQQPAGKAGSSRTSSAVSLEAILEHAGQSSQRTPQGLPAISNSTSGEEQPVQSAALPIMPNSRGPTLPPLLFGVSLDAVSEGMIRRLSSGASSNGGELIAALHSPEPAAQLPLDSPRSPLPAPPQHLKTFLSSGKRYASPLSARSSPASAAPEPAGGAHPAAAAVPQKGLSFADLVGVKGRRSSLSGKKPSRPGAQKSHCFGAPATLTVGMVLTGPVGGKPAAAVEKPAPTVDAPMDKLPGSEPAEGVAVPESAAGETLGVQPAEAVPVSADSLPELQGQGSAEAGAADVSQSKSESAQQGNIHNGPAGAREGPSSSEVDPGQDLPDTSLEQDTVIWEEPSSSGRMHLAPEGGAVLLTNPDGSTQLVLLTSDQRQQVAAAQSWKLPPPALPTYTALSTPEDLRMQQRIARADEIMRRLYESLQQSSASASEAQSSSPGGGAVQDDFAERLKRADEAFQSALNARATKTGIDAADGIDTSDDKLQRLIAERDAAMFKSS